MLDFKDVWEAHETKAALFIDARLPQEYQAGHIKGAISIPYDQREAHLQALRKMAGPQQRIIVYCDGQECGQSKKLSGYLIQQGWRNVQVFRDGFPAWQEAGLEVSVGDKP